MSARNDLVSEWIASAEADIAWARLGASHPDLPGNEQIGFHAQQATEKLIKAVLIWYGIEPETHHNLGRLIHQLRTLDRFTAAQISEASKLTKYAAYLRYPARPGTDRVMPSYAEVVEDLRVAEKACEALKATLTQMLSVSAKKAETKAQAPRRVAR